MKTNVYTGQSSDWLSNNPACSGWIQIGSSRKEKVTERSEAAKREYWSTYWRKRNHIASGCTCW